MLIITLVQGDGVYVSDEIIQKAKENNGEALYKIGFLYFFIDKKKAFMWFYKAALQNYGESQSKVGYMYQYAEGVDQNNKLAMEWYQKAAANGYKDAIDLMDHLKYNTDGTESISTLKGKCLIYKLYISFLAKCKIKENTNGLSEEEIQKAVEARDTERLNDTAYSYHKGIGVTANINTAIDIYTLAADQGSAKAQYSLGVIYELYDHVKDQQKAINWYQKAADSGYDFAKDGVKGLNRRGYYAKDGEQQGKLYWYFVFDLH
jgi:TPR repeat protein